MLLGVNRIWHECGEFLKDLARSALREIARRPRHFAYVLMLIGVIWTTLFVGLLYGMQPKLSWMILAGLGGCIILTLILMRFQELRRDSSAEDVARGVMASQAVLFVAILIGNIAVVVHMARDYTWTSEDWLAFRAALILLGVFFLLAPLRFIVRKMHDEKDEADYPKKWAWLFALQWRTPWAMCCYTLILKVEPQFVDGIAGSQIAWWTAISFVLLAGRRVDDALIGWRQQPRSSSGLALLVSMSFDLVSLLVVSVGPIWKAVSHVAAYGLH